MPTAQLHHSYTQNINYYHDPADQSTGKNKVFGKITNLSFLFYNNVLGKIINNKLHTRFASQPDGSAWPGKSNSAYLVSPQQWQTDCTGDHGGWVCSTSPMAGTVTYDCLPEVQLALMRLQ